MNILSFKTSLKTTTSLCPVCHDQVSAEIWKTHTNPGQVYLTKSCPAHGEFDVCLASDARFYWLAKGNEANSCGSGCACSASPQGTTGSLGVNAFKPNEVIEKLSTCLALIEIVDSCNLACPTCFADSPIGTGSSLKYHAISDLQQRIEGVISRKGKLEMLQLSGGEPTLHPEFFALIDWIQDHPSIDYCLINTNGVKLVKDKVFAEQLGVRAQRGHLQIYLQYDGVDEQATRSLRGADLRDIKLQVMQICETRSIPFTLAMTVTDENKHALWESLAIGLPFEYCRGIAFQPMFTSGRNAVKTHNPINTADIIIHCVTQSQGTLRFEDFTPLPCGDPNCATIGYLLRTPLGIRSISDFIDFSKIQGFLKDKVRYELEDLIQCGCENTELGALLHHFEMKEKHAFRIFIKPFMDAWTWDQDRIDRCCTHVIRPDGELDSFCRYYLSAPGSHL